MGHSTSVVRKNGQFTHDSTVFGHDVRGKRFITHVSRVFVNIHWGKKKSRTKIIRTALIVFTE